MEVIRLTQGAEGGGACVRFTAADPVFKGHFPQAPVLPGVILIDAAVEIVSRVMKQPLRLERLASAKFCSVVLPDEEIGFAFKAAHESGGSERIKVSGRWFRDTEKIAELVFTTAPCGKEGGTA